MLLQILHPMNRCVPLALLLPALVFAGCQLRSNANSDLPDTNTYEIVTSLGSMTIELSDQTPAHRDNFKKLVADGFYEGTTFHRVIAGFMIQGGDPNSKDTDRMNDGGGGPGYTVPAEIRSELFHKRGALAAARQPDAGNPQRASSGSQFYLVHGTIFPPEVLEQYETRARQTIPDSTFAFSPEAMQAYTTEGGAPNLDGMYTVFGQLVGGFDVLDAITRVARGEHAGQRSLPLATMPLTDLTMTIRPVE